MKYPACYLNHPEAKIQIEKNIAEQVKSFQQMEAWFEEQIIDSEKRAFSSFAKVRGWYIAFGVGLILLIIKDEGIAGAAPVSAQATSLCLSFVSIIIVVFDVYNDQSRFLMRIKFLSKNKLRITRSLRELKTAQMKLAVRENNSDEDLDMPQPGERVVSQESRLVNYVSICCTVVAPVFLILAAIVLVIAAYY